jgi:hypothetical protein
MGFLDNVFGSSDSASQDYLNKALAAYRDINVPTTESGTVNALPMQTVQGTVNPDNIEVAAQGPTAYNNISLDPATRAAQMSALGEYSNIASTGGLDANAKLAIQQANDAATRQSQGEQGAIMRSAQAMGQGGGDFALTQRALAAQGASNTAATTGMQAAAEAEANREAALNAMANIGGGINAADFSQAAAKAASENAINATNTGARNAANTNDVSNRVQTGEFNVGNAQNVNAANTTAGQNKVYYNAALPQQRFQNELQKAGGIAGVSGQQATAAQNATNANLGFTGTLLGTAGTVAGAAMGGPAGAMIGSQLGKTVQPRPVAQGPLQQNGQFAKGGYACYADGGIAHDHAICMKLGGHVSGEAKVDGDSEQNDTVPAMLSPGELVIPRSVPKDGEHMEEFARNAPVGGDTKKKVDLTSFTSGYKRGK